MVRTEVSTALELILDGRLTGGTKALGPLAVDLPFQVEGALLVSDVTGSHEEGKADPQQEGVVPGEETSVELNASSAQPTKEVTIPVEAAMVEMASSSVFPTRTTLARSQTRNHVSRQ